MHKHTIELISSDIVNSIAMNLATPEAKVGLHRVLRASLDVVANPVSRVGDFLMRRVSYIKFSSPRFQGPPMLLDYPAKKIIVSVARIFTCGGGA